MTSGGFRPVIVLVYFLLLGGCASHSTKVRSVEEHFSSGDFASALTAVEEADYPNRDQVLYLMDKAMILRASGQYTDSNELFEQAKRLMEEWTATSISETSLRWTLNDAASSYVGSPVEQLMIHIYAALNYLETGRLAAARVEALQMDQLIRALSRDTDKLMLADTGLAHYLTGIVFEDLGEWSDAMIAYRKAYQAYTRYGDMLGEQVPTSLKHDLLRLSQYLGLNEEMVQYRDEFGLDEWTPLAQYQQQGELVFFFHNGLAPIKEEHSNVVPALGNGQLIRISLPYYRDRGTPATSLRLHINGKSLLTERAANINAAARQTLEQQMPEIIARTAARNVVKYQTAREVGEQNDIAGLLLNVFNVLTETADTRSWLTLPAEIQIARIPLAPGNYTCDIEVLDATGAAHSRHSFNDLTIEAGETRYLSYHWTPLYIPLRRH